MGVEQLLALFLDIPHTLLGPSRILHRDTLFPRELVVDTDAQPLDLRGTELEALVEVGDAVLNLFQAHRAAGTGFAAGAPR
ncbi:hypothetical protein [Allorhizocola rhizosphaerae]|uniref:hypothetical protein n=1 Tax=Allorhizocola rhizosphaerae TaxID=1872709 RepID=UPI000E3EA560|nr:hypothetical protein [Allorhizocola rhizosphaerae]